MEEDIAVFTADSGSYIESLINSWTRIPDGHRLEAKLEELIIIEIELALLGAEKAKSEILKRTTENVRPIK